MSALPDPSALCQLLGMRLPVVQAPMAGAQDSALAMAVCAAGGLGSLPGAALSLPELREQLQRLQAQAVGPYNVNFFCHRPPVADVPQQAAWLATLAPLYAQAAVTPPSTPAVAAREPFSAAVAELLQAFRPPVLSFHFGLPAPDLLAQVRSWGAKVLCSATTLAEARWLEARGVDVIIAQGLEAGGHRGMFLTDDLTTQIGTFALLPQVARAVRVPVLAAGGIADAAGVAAAQALGAAGVQVGTAYLLCPEALTSPLHRQALQSEAAQHTALTNIFTGRPARGVVNRAMRVLGQGAVGMNAQAPAFPLAASALAPLRRAAEAAGRDDFTPLWAGQHVPSGHAGAPRSAAAVTLALAQGWRR